MKSDAVVAAMAEGAPLHKLRDLPAVRARGQLRADRPTLLVGGMLAGITVGAWAIASRMDMAMYTSVHSGPQLVGAIGFVGTWVVMMTAMMLPSAAPLVLLYRIAGPGGRAAHALPVVAGYLVTWASFGALVYAAQQVLVTVFDVTSAWVDARPYAGAGILAVAGVYQFTSLKKACLLNCRSPLDFLIRRWRGSGVFGALRLGADHGAYCVGCCWALMAVLVGAGSMSLLWMVLIALLVFMEKVMAFGERGAQLSGAGLGLLALLVAVRPDLSILARASGTGM